MIFADVHGKLGSGAEKATARAEDALTSTVFGTLRYLPPAAGLVGVLSKAREVFLDEQGAAQVRTTDGWSPTVGASNAEVQFWPRLGAHGEVDLIVRLFDLNGGLLQIVLVEAKYLSAKSRNAEGEQIVPDAATDPDQLVDYWLGGCALPDANRSNVQLVYLTRHALPPLRELGDSLRRRPGMRLAWLSWRDAWSVARAASADSLPAADLTRYLAKKRLAYFDGFHANAPQRLPIYAPRFAKELLFRFRVRVPDGVSVWSSCDPHFWRR